MLLGKCVLKICSKFTGEHPCRTVISIKLHHNFIKITLWHGYSHVNLLHIFKTPELTGEHPCRSVISIKLLCNFSEISLQHGCSPVNLIHVFGILFYKNTYRGQLFKIGENAGQELIA